MGSAHYTKFKIVFYFFHRLTKFFFLTKMSQISVNVQYFTQRKSVWISGKKSVKKVLVSYSCTPCWTLRTRQRSQMKTIHHSKTRFWTRIISFYRFCYFLFWNAITETVLLHIMLQNIILFRKYFAIMVTFKISISTIMVNFKITISTIIVTLT